MWGCCGKTEAGDSKLKAHLRELHLFPSSSPDGQESPCQNPAGCPSYWKCTRAHTHMLYTVTQTQANINTDVQYTRTQTLYRCNWKLQSERVLSGDVRTHFSTRSVLLLSLTLWPWDWRESTREATFSLSTDNGTTICFWCSFTMVLTANSPTQGRLRPFKDDMRNCVCHLL